MPCRSEHIPSILERSGDVVVLEDPMDADATVEDGGH
jgi:hypothetical protein